MATTRKPWSREELLILLNLYDKIPFGKFDKGNPVLIEVAECMERTPSSLAMKLSNLASLDERLAARGIKGLSGASALDRSVWAEYRADHEVLAVESEELLTTLVAGFSFAAVDVRPESIRVVLVPEMETEYLATVTQRRGQSFFRQAVLNAYGGRCALTGLAIPELLVASHIVPWKRFGPDDPVVAAGLDAIIPKVAHGHRLDVRNGIALNALHDRAFDRGFITFDADLRMRCCPLLRDQFSEPEIAREFKAFEGKPLVVPEGTEGPHPAYLEWHKNWAFQQF